MRISRLNQTGRLDPRLDDPEALLLRHPANIAFRGSELIAANLGRWHLTIVDVGIAGLSLPVSSLGEGGEDDAGR